MSNFALDTGSSQGDIISSLNYVLANLGTIDANIIANIAANIANTTITSANVVTANTVTGTLQSNTVGTFGYLYNYVNIKYANNVTGSSGFSSNSTNKSYYGVHNTTSGTISSNPADYQWKQVVGGFGTTKGLYYTTVGGGQIFFSANTTGPTVNYQPVVDDSPILLQSIANSIVTTQSITPGAITANLLAANLVIARDIVSTNATLGDLTSAGYWFQANTGNARIGGNINIGNNLTVGNNAVIGGNLTVAGLITSANLNANTVATSTMQLNSATVTGAVNNAGYTLTNPTVSYGGASSGYYIYTTGNIIPFGAGILATTPTVTNIISGYLDVFGYTTTPGAPGSVFAVPQIYAELARYVNGSYTGIVSPTFVTTPASNSYSGTFVTTLTALPVRLSEVSIVDQFTIGSPSTIQYYWLWGAYLSMLSNSAPTQPNITVGSYGITVTNYKR